MAIEVFAPAKINLTLHVTGRREDGYHQLDSLVVFAGIGDRIAVAPAESANLSVTGPMADGVPLDDNNIVLRAARQMGIAADIQLEKFLPAAAGVGGGSSDAAATLRALAQVSGRAVPSDAIRLGADVPVCLANRASRMRGIGERVEPVDGFPALDVVLVNPGAPVPTPMVFDHMSAPNNPPMPDSVPAFPDLGGCVEWLRAMRNDLEAPAIAVEPAIADVCETLDKTPGCMLTRLSGSGATCFGIYADAETAAAAAGRLHEAHPGWWVVATRLNASS